MAGRSSRRARGGAARPGGAPSLAALPVGEVVTSTGVARLERRESGILLLLDGTESSWIDLVDPAHLDFEYQQQMNAVLDVLMPGAPVRAVHLGGAGCALARAWEALRPGSTQLAVEIDAVLARRVREWFDLPRAPRLRIRVGDAAEVAPSLREGEWDVVVRDVFANGRVPASCRTEEMLRACRRALAPGGVYLANTASAPREEAGAELAAVRRVFGGGLVVADAACVRGRRRGNLVVVAGTEPLSPDQVQEVDRAVRRLPLPVRTWSLDDPALPRA
ncbi:MULTISPECIES: fused MFS/spermidine synthase [unclassified Actinomyces]|uniref:spermidine synthase n=1 Tax=unclassified Actinomyces TaxID=2609248 RepID=UPI002016C6C5|nr:MULTISPECIES: fused MFS/spermidine synthase [unclassified Actinomyces]MCL3778260.1 fused MFS/spermidine synthase [Actinomyces sp. AC-20-1]MCL3790438.1 fused MFS/spermidine synthase [Actinomyces sp. 187325]MCL3792715.1 fused MFS/spermidine synthase [Actinomyces sp. 186855]MCL3795195.1 fused MFS/spermidine synthase [Actinomyces sp. 217892]